MKAIERLEELLDEKDNRIKQLEADIESRDDDKEVARWLWARHRILEDDDGLPVPRLEIRCVPDDDEWYQYHWDYSLIYRHTLGQIVAVPMGHTNVGGGGQIPIHGGQISTPFRDGVHIMKDSVSLNLPAFAICVDAVETIKCDAGKITQAPYARNEATETSNVG